MGHDHHEHNDSYYQEQLATIAICGAFAVAAITLYFWKQSILKYMFGESSLFHDFILWSGIALLFLVLLRAITLWRAVGQPASTNDCSHDHDHGHEHDCGHEHHHEHDHDHEHAHREHAHHEHAHHENTHGAVSCSSGHDHGAAPWRYVVLLIPIILFLLDLPNQGPQAAEREVAVRSADPQAAPVYGSLVGVGPLPLPQLVLAAAVMTDGPVYGMDFKSLEAAALDEFRRKEWQGKTVRVVGQFASAPRSDRLFRLVRYRIQCCAADAVEYSIPALCRESLAGIKLNDWVQVTGQIQFQRERNGPGYMTVLLVPRRRNVALTDPDPNPYIQ